MHETFLWHPALAKLSCSWVLLNVAQQLVEFTVSYSDSWMSQRVKDSLNSKTFRKRSDWSDWSERVHGDFQVCCLLDLCLATCRCLHTEEWPRAQLRADEMFRASKQRLLFASNCLHWHWHFQEWLANLRFWGCNHGANRKARYHPASLGLLKSISPPTWVWWVWPIRHRSCQFKGWRFWMSLLLKCSTITMNKVFLGLTAIKT